MSHTWTLLCRLGTKIADAIELTLHIVFCWDRPPNWEPKRVTVPKSLQRPSKLG